VKTEAVFRADGPDDPADAGEGALDGLGDCPDGLVAGAPGHRLVVLGDAVVVEADADLLRAELNERQRSLDAGRTDIQLYDLDGCVEPRTLRRVHPPSMAISVKTGLRTPFSPGQIPDRRPARVPDLDRRAPVVTAYRTREGHARRAHT